MSFVAACNTHLASFELKKGDVVPEWAIEKYPQHFEDLVKAGFIVGAGGSKEEPVAEAEELPAEEAKPKKRKKE